MTENLALFCLHYADFCYGDESHESCQSFEEAKEIMREKPADSKIAYQYWVGHKALFTKPAGHEGSYWTNEHTGDGSNGQGHLFLWGIDTGHTQNGRTLIYMRGVDAAGGKSDGDITSGISSFEQALELAKASTKNDIAYTWHEPTMRFIEKPPSLASGDWCEDDNCVFFVWVDSKIKELTPEEKAAIEEEKRLIEESKNFHIPSLLPEPEPTISGPFQILAAHKQDLCLSLRDKDTAL